ncbi:MAG: glycosyltransferase family 2 protein [Clostridia bacterium]|nr:glycosyltransferase family 2 protein [Clostridia bacterium]
MFSIIIPVYNGEKFIDNAIKSVLAQTYEDWELVVVDDGSKDNTAQVLEAYADNEKIHIFHQQNGGVSAARNKGMQEAVGSHFAFLDADDLWLENHLEVMAELIDAYPDAGLYATFAQINLSDERSITSCNYFQNNAETVYLEDFFAEYHRDKTVKVFVPTSTVISREANDKVGGFPVGCKIGEDLEHDLRIAAYYPIVITKRITAVYEKRNSTATKDTSFDPDWSFFETVKPLYEDTQIPKAKRDNIKLIMDWFTIRRCRHYVIDGKKKKAWTYFWQKTDSSLAKDKFITMILLFMPCALVRKIFQIRWRNIG